MGHQSPSCRETLSRMEPQQEERAAQQHRVMQAEERQHHQPLWKTLAKAQVYTGGNKELPPRAIFHDFW